MAEQNKANAGLILGAGAAGLALATAINLANSRPAMAASPDSKPIVLDDATIALLQAIATANGAILDAITGINVSGGTTTIGVVPNADEIISSRMQVIALGTAYRLPQLLIPDDMEVQIKGWPTNGGLILLASTAPAAKNLGTVWPLLPNEHIGYRIKDLENIWFSGTQVGDWVTWTVEHRK